MPVPLPEHEYRRLYLERERHCLEWRRVMILPQISKQLRIRSLIFPCAPRSVVRYARGTND
jgi:hypothetical protein